MGVSYRTARSTHGSKEARKAVGDTGKQQRVIKTIHRRGYQFVAEVSVTSGDAPDDKTRTSNPASNSEKPSIAVLRFNNLSNSPEQTYFSDGMAVNVCSRLSRIRSLLVKSGIEIDLGDTTLAEVAQELEVRYVLSGSVRREADHVRVFVELTEGASGDIQWSEHFDRHGNDVIDIQDDIAQAITGTLWNVRGTIREAERDRLTKKPTSDFNAFDYILKGIYCKEQYKAEELERAHQFFDKAIELDPESAEAYGWNAWVYLLEMWLDSASNIDESLNQALVAAKKSIALDAFSEMGHWTLSEVYMDMGDNRKGFIELEKALDINPNNPDLMVHKGTMLSTNGQFDEGIKWIQQGFEFNKHFPEWYYWHYGIAFFAGHRWQESIDAFIRMGEQNKDTLTYLAASYVQTENLAEARKCFAELLRIDPEIDPEAVEKAHAYLAAETQQFLIEGIRHLMIDELPLKKLRVVKR